MVIEVMPYAECHTMLTRASFARLACAVDNEPYIVPIHVDFADGFLYGFSTIGQKIAWMRMNPRVCLEIEEFASHNDWATLIIVGQYEELPDTPENAYPRNLAERLFQRHPVWWQPAAVQLAGHPPQNPILFRILISRVSGRRAKPDVDDAPYIPDGAGEGRLNWVTRVLRRILNRQQNHRP